MDWSTFRLSRRLDFGAETTATAYRLLSEIDSIKKGWSIIGKLQPATINPLSPALRSGPTTAPGASLQKQIPAMSLVKSGCDFLAVGFG